MSKYYDLCEEIARAALKVSKIEESEFVSENWMENLEKAKEELEGKVKNYKIYLEGN